MRPPDTLRQVAERALAGEPWRMAVGDFLDLVVRVFGDRVDVRVELSVREVLAP